MRELCGSSRGRAWNPHVEPRHTVKRRVSSSRRFSASAPHLSDLENLEPKRPGCTWAD